MTQVAVLLQTSKLAPGGLPFAVAAVNDQAAECAAAWGVPVVPVVCYSSTDPLPPETTHVIGISDSISTAGALGMHDDFAGIIWGEILAQASWDETSPILSHEVLEMLVDPTCEAWRAMPDGRAVALEVCDPVEALIYLQNATVLGESRPVPVSDYVTLAWFTAGGAAPYDRMQRIAAPFAMAAGGYRVVQDTAGNVINEFADKIPDSFARKLGNARSRTLQRLRRSPGAGMGKGERT